MRALASHLIYLLLFCPQVARADLARQAPLRLSDDLEKSIDGKPSIHLDDLVFPSDIVDAPSFEKHLRRVLKREAYRVDWGAGQDNRIEYRFTVEKLSYTVDGRALRIRCEATGRLPGGQTAKSALTFGGDIGSRKTLTKQVLEIVGRGVITRLAELERRRRGLN